MQLRELQYIIQPLQRVLIYDYLTLEKLNDQGCNCDGLDFILYDGYWYNARYMNSNVISMYVKHYDLDDVLVLEVHDVRDNKETD